MLLIRHASPTWTESGLVANEQKQAVLWSSDASAVDGMLNGLATVIIPSIVWVMLVEMVLASDVCVLKHIKSGSCVPPPPSLTRSCKSCCPLGDGRVRFSGIRDVCRRVVVWCPPQPSPPPPSQYWFFP